MIWLNLPHRCRLAALVVLGFTLLWATSAAAAIKVTLVLSDMTATYRDAADTLREELEQESQHWQVRVQNLAERREPSSEDLLIPLGLRALRSVLAEPGGLNTIKLPPGNLPADPGR